MRRYGHWAGNENGVTENLGQCAAEVGQRHTPISKQCGHKRTIGLLCKQHNDELAAGKYVSIPDNNV